MSPMPPRKTVLIADDTNTVRALIVDFLSQRTDLEICGEAINGFAAIEKAKKLKPDLILLDISMPVMTGLEAAAILKESLPGTAIILFTMTADHYRPALIKAIGVDAVLAKPDGLVALGDAVDSVLARRNRSAPPAS